MLSDLRDLNSSFSCTLCFNMISSNLVLVMSMLLHLVIKETLDRINLHWYLFCMFNTTFNLFLRNSLEVGLFYNWKNTKIHVKKKINKKIIKFSIVPVFLIFLLAQEVQFTLCHFYKRRHIESIFLRALFYFCTRDMV